MGEEVMAIRDTFTFVLGVLLCCALVGIGLGLGTALIVFTLRFFGLGVE